MHAYTRGTERQGFICYTSIVDKLKKLALFILIYHIKLLNDNDKQSKIFYDVPYHQGGKREGHQ